MKAQQELVVVPLQPVLALLAEQKLLILMTRKTDTLTMQLQPLKAMLLRPKLQQKLQHRLLKVLLLPLKLQHRRPKVLHHQPKLRLLKLQHQLLKALHQLQMQSSWTVRCI
jgi:hypothetical protein